MTVSRRAWLRAVLIVAVVLVLIVGVTAEVFWTRPERESVQTYFELISAANLQDVSHARSLCSQRYLRTHELRPAPEGGLVGLPRSIHKNFQAWRHGHHVWLCPSNRVGPIFQFVHEARGWKFDGPIGLLQSRGRVVLMPDLTEPEARDRPE